MPDPRVESGTLRTCLPVGARSASPALAAWQPSARASACAQALALPSPAESGGVTAQRRGQQKLRHHSFNPLECGPWSGQGGFCPRLVEPPQPPVHGRQTGGAQPSWPGVLGGEGLEESKGHAGFPALPPPLIKIVPVSQALPTRPSVTAKFQLSSCSSSLGLRSQKVSGCGWAWGLGPGEQMPLPTRGAGQRLSLLRDSRDVAGSSGSRVGGLGWHVWGRSCKPRR